MLVDTHCHLDASRWPEGTQAVLDRAASAGVTGFVVVGVAETLDSAREAIALAEQHPNRIRAAVGLHPHDARVLGDSMRDELEALARHDAVVAVGEAGLDYHYDHSPREVQREVFRWMISLARRVKKPLVVHTREARDDTLAILDEEGAREVGGIIHCFSEDVAFARRALELGFYLSFSGILTFKNANSVHEAATFSPADRLLVETDSPYLAPVPMRGKRCEPAYVAYTAKRLAELRETTLEAIAETTTSNAARLLGFDFDARAHA